MWRELTLLGERVRDAYLEADARAVARETMRQARRNIEMLIPRLEIMLDIDTKLGYSGLGGHEVIVPGATADALLDNYPEHLTPVEYVRRRCRWGGFPGLEMERKRHRDVQEWLHGLTEEFMPV